MDLAGFVTQHVEKCEFTDAPIPPEWVREGTPRARSGSIAMSPDQLYSVGVWDCTAGRFEWTFYCDETVHILEGSVEVQARGASGKKTLQAGDVAYFPKGLVTEWNVTTYVRKLAVYRSPVRSFPGRVLARLRRLAR